MGEHADHGPVATHPVLLGIAAVAFLVLIVLGFQLKLASGYHDAGHNNIEHSADQKTDTDH